MILDGFFEHAGASILRDKDAAVASFLLALTVIIVTARLLYLEARRLGQPGVVGEIVAGLLLGPSLLGHYAPGVWQAVFGDTVGAPMTMLSELSLMLLMFHVGADFDFNLLSQERRRRGLFVIAAASVSVPLLSGAALGWIAGPVLAPKVDRLAFALFFSVALAITAMPTLGRILREFGLNRTLLGVTAISTAAINDIVGWILLAAVAAYATAVFQPLVALIQVSGILLLLLLLLFAVGPVVDRMLRRSREGEGGFLNTVAWVVAGVLMLGFCTSKLGVFSVFGAFAAGLLFQKHRDLVDRWNDRINPLVLVCLLPVFFTLTGMRTDIHGLTLADAPWLAAAMAAAALSKIGPVYLPPGQAASAAMTPSRSARS